MRARACVRACVRVCVTLCNTIVVLVVVEKKLHSDVILLLEMAHKRS